MPASYKSLAERVNKMKRYLACLFSIGCLLCSTETVSAQRRSLPIRDLCVDMLKVDGGPRLLGSFVSRDEQGNIEFVVQRDWLKKEDAVFYRKAHQAEVARIQERFEMLLTRIADWKAERNGIPALVRFLDAETERIQKLKMKAKNEAFPQTQFVLVSISASQVQTSYGQPADRKQLAVASWKEQISDVEKSSALKLFKTLEEKKINWKAPIDLSDRIPPHSQSESNEQWAARQALLEYRFVKSVDLQGKGDLLYSTNGARPNMTKLIAETMQAELQNQLQELLNPDLKRPVQQSNWIEKAGKIAEQEEVQGCRVTRVDLRYQQKQVKVEASFLAKMPAGKWKVIWQQSKTLDATVPRKEIEKEIGENEELKKSLKLIESLGVGGGQLQTAIRFGAATHEGQQEAEKLFHTFWNRYNQKLDTPPVTLP